MENKKYTATDFEHYHAGNMSVNEMYLLEKATLHDPFLADALDGYKTTKNNNAALKHLHQKLTEKIKAEKTPVNFFANKWWAAAAAIVGIVGIAFLFNKFNKIDGTNIAAVEKKQNIDSTKNAVIQKVDSITVANETIANNGLQQNTLKQTDIIIPPATYKSLRGDSKAKEEKISDENYYATTSSRTDTSEVGRGFLTATEKSAAGRFDNVVVDDAAAKQSEFKKSVSDSISFNKKEAAPVATTVNTKMSNVGYGEKEDVVVAMGVSKKSRKAFKDKISNADVKNMVQLNSDIAAFKKFVENNKNKALIVDSGILGIQEVYLLFDTDFNGNAINIKVSKSLTLYTACDTEAIRLLKAAPAWGSKNMKNISVSISFSK